MNEFTNIPLILRDYNNGIVFKCRGDEMKQKQRRNEGLEIKIKDLENWRRQPGSPFVVAQERSPWGDDSSEETSSPRVSHSQKPVGHNAYEDYISEDEQGVAEQHADKRVDEVEQEEVRADDQIHRAQEPVVNVIVENYLSDFELLGSSDLSDSHEYNRKMAPNKLNKVTFAQHLADTYSAIKLHNLKAIKYLANLVADDMEIAVREKLFKKFPAILNELNLTHDKHVNLLVSVCKNTGKICGDELANFAKQELIAYLEIGDQVAREKAGNIVGFDVNQYFKPQKKAAFNALLAIAEQIGKDYKHRIKPAVLKHILLAIQTLGKAECDMYRAFVAEEFVTFIKEKLDNNLTNLKKYSEKLIELHPDDLFRAEITADDEEPIDKYN